MFIDFVSPELKVFMQQLNTNSIDMENDVKFMDSMKLC